MAENSNLTPFLDVVGRHILANKVIKDTILGVHFILGTKSTYVEATDRLLAL